MLSLEKQLAKRKLRIRKLQPIPQKNEMDLHISPTSAVDMNSRQSSPSPINVPFYPLFMPNSYFMYPIIHSSPCIPTTSWIPCDSPAGIDLLCVGKVLQTENLTPMYRSFHDLLTVCYGIESTSVNFLSFILIYFSFIFC